MSPNDLPPSPSTSAEHHDSDSSFESTVLPVATTVASTGEFTTEPTLPPRPPGSLHLTPCSLEQFLELGNPPEDPYELVDGLLVSVPMADDTEHNSIIHYLAWLISLLPLAFDPRVVAFSNRAYALKQHGHSGNVRHEASSSISFRRSSEVSGSSHQNTDTCRIPDIFISKRADGSEATGHSDSPHQKERRGTPAWKKAIMIIEVTSTNRATDFGPKLEEYEKEGILEYVIVDRQKGMKKPKPCVHVYKLSETTNKYVHKVFRGGEKVECSFFCYWNLSANDMLNYQALRGKCDKADKEYKKSKERADRAEDKAQKEQKRADRAEDKAQKEQDRANRLEQQLNDLLGKKSAKTNHKRKKTEAKSTDRRSDKPPSVLSLRLNLSPKKTTKGTGSESSSPPPQSPTSPQPPASHRRRVADSDGAGEPKGKTCRPR